MARPTPEYLQLAALLDFLYESLRADTTLLGLICDPDALEPDRIVCKTLEHDPFEMRPGDKGPQLSLLYEQELPVLCCWEESSEYVWTGSTNGELAKLQLIYLFRTHLGNATVTPKAWNARLSKIISWRICGYLQGHTLTDWGDTGDLFNDGFIRDISIGRITRLASKELEGFSMELSMLHEYPPHTAAAPGDLETIDLEVHEDDVIPATSGPIVEATLDATPSE